MPDTGGVLRVAALIVIVLGGCAAPVVAPRPTVTVRPQSTATPVVPTATPAPDYATLRSALRNPLSSLIVSVRNGDAQNTSAFLTEFNAAANAVLIRLGDDASPQATGLRATIQNVRAEPRNLKVLEREREALLFPTIP